MTRSCKTTFAGWEWGRVWLILLSLLAGCQHQPEGGRAPEPVPVPVHSGAEIPPQAAYFAKYHLQSGDELEIFYHFKMHEVAAYTLNIYDVIELKFVDVPELSLEQVIRPDGRITAPLLGAVHVLGLTPEQAATKLREAYVGTLDEPNVYMILKDFGRRIEELRRVLSDPADGQSRDIVIGPDGTAVFPIIGAAHVGGKTIAEANQIISRRYRKKHNELQVDLALKKTANQLVYALGEVQKPGAFSINRPLSIGQVLALAGGATEGARLDEIVLVRRTGGVFSARKLDYLSEVRDDRHDAAISIGQPQRGRREMDQIRDRWARSALVLLGPDDILYVPKRPLANAAQIATEIREMLMFRGFSIGYDIGDNFN